MNMVSCGEDCRYQIDGYCTRSDLTVNDSGKCARTDRNIAAGNSRVVYRSSSDVSASSKCCYFEQR